MKIVRRGNNVLINWYVTNLGVPMDFSGKKVEVRLLDKYNTMCLFDYTITENVISGTFYGKDQITPGPYHLLLICDAGKKGQIMLDSREIFGIRECLPDGTSVGGEHVADVVEVRVDSNINSLVGLCFTKLYYKDGTVDDPGEEHEYNLLDVEIVVPEGYTGAAATIYSKESIDKLIADNVKGLEDRMDNIHEEVNNQKLNITEYNANREADKAELEAYKADKAKEFEEHVAGFEKYKLDHKAEMIEELAKKANKAETEVILNTKANKTDVETALSGKVDNATFEAHKVSNQNALDTKANKTDLASSEAAIQSKIDNINTSLDSHKSDFEAHKSAALAALDTKANKTDVETALSGKVDNATFEAHKISNQDALDLKANKTDVETALSGKVDNATFEAHKDTYETFKTNTEVALNSKADIANTYNKAEVDTKILNAVTGNVDVYTKTEIDAKLTGMVKIQKLTQAEYDALETKDENVLYAIIEPATEG